MADNFLVEKFPLIEDFICNSNTLDSDSQHWLEGIELWLSMFKDRDATYRSYRKEAERFLLWSLYINNKSLHQLEVSDVMRYSKFLLNVIDTHPHWCGGRYKRDSINWKPFFIANDYYTVAKDKRHSGLSKESHDLSLNILTSLFSWLVADARLSKNVFKLTLNKHKASTSQLDSARAFSWKEINIIFEVLNDLPEDTDERARVKARNLWLFRLLLMTGLRCSEITTSSFAIFERKENNFFINIVGKGNKLRSIPVNPYLRNAMIEYRKYFDLSSLPYPNDQTPLVYSVRGNQAIKSRALNQVIKSVLEKSAEKVHLLDPYMSLRLKQGSPHSFRGSFASELNKQKVNQKTLQNLMGHSSINTTSRYLLVEQEDMVDAVNQIRNP